jgi:dipeptidyl aminopeptidase/acylaminoacyl peptidase
MLLLVVGAIAARPAPPATAGPRLVVVVWDGATATLGVVDATGRFGSELAVADPLRAGGRAALAPDGRRVALTVAQAGADPASGAQLLLVERERASVVSLVEGVDLRGRPVWSPDGTQVAYRRHDPTSGRDELWAHNLATGAAAMLERGPPGVGLLLVGWTATGPLVARFDHTGSWLALAGGEGQLLSASLVRDFALAPDGRWVAFSEYGPRPQLGLVGPTGVLRLAVPGPYVHPAWTADGRLTITGKSEQLTPLALEAPVPIATVAAAAPGQVTLPVAWSAGGWLAARTVQLGADGSVVTERLELVGRDGQRVPVVLPGVAAALGWIEE